MAKTAHALPVEPLVTAPHIRHEGRAITLRDGKEYILPALTFRELDQWSETIGGLLGKNLISDAPARKQFAEVILVALQHNYPALTLDGLYEIIDLRNQKNLLRFLYDLNGFSPEPEPTEAVS
jgi:hypothetical protein